MEDSPTFCFHSVRPTLAIPPASAWPSEELHAEMVAHLHVEHEWFYEWLPRAKKEWGPHIHVTFDDAFRDVMVPAIWAVQKHKVKTTVFAPTFHLGTLFPYAPYDVMDGSEIGFLAGQGVEIGSHGHRHEDMRRYSFWRFKAALDMSMEIIEGCTQQTVASFAPPHAHFTAEQVRYASEERGLVVYGTHLYPAGRFGSKKRWQADMNGYRDGDGDEHPWPWEM